MTDPQPSLPLCHTCQGPMSRGLYEAAQWTCMRCWGGWLAGAPEPEPPKRDFYGEVRIVEMDPAPPGLDWSDN